MGKTIDVIKEKRTVSHDVKENIKVFNKLKKEILKSLESGQKTIPEIAKDVDSDIDVITYHVMTLIKYGSIIAGNLDDNDEFYYYELKKKK
jgi:predicted transcriptional regulator